MPERPYHCTPIAKPLPYEMDALVNQDPAADESSVRNDVGRPIENSNWARRSKLFRKIVNFLCYRAD